MKRVSEKIPGGRIRKVRLDSGMTLKELAVAVNMTSNHLSMVERGEKKPSPRLLEKVAAVTGVSLEWLRDGDDDSSNDTMSLEDYTVKKSQYRNPIQIDIRMFLALILMETPGMSKEKLAITLDVPENIVDAILKGQDTNYRPQWDFFFSGLAQRLDTPAVCSKLRTLAAYLEAKAEEGKQVRLIQLWTSLQRYTETKCNQDLKPVGTFRKVKEHVPYFRMQFQGDGGRCWEFRYVQAADIDNVADYATETMGNVPQHVSLSIVFDDKTVYDAFVKKAIDYAKTADMPTTEAPAGCPLIRAILIGRETYVVQDEENCWPVKND